MADKAKRGKKSKIDNWPEQLRKLVNQLLTETGQSQQDILDIVNEEAEKLGAEPVSKSALSRHAQKVEEATKYVKAAREQAETFVKGFGESSTTDLTEGSLESMRAALFHWNMKMMAEPDEVHPGIIKEAALAMQRIASASSINLKVQKEIRRAFAEEAAEAVSEELRGVDGTSEELEDRIRKVLLGKA